MRCGTTGMWDWWDVGLMGWGLVGCGTGLMWDWFDVGQMGSGTDG